MRHIGYNFCIIPNGAHDCPFIGIYNEKGERWFEEIASNLPELTKKILEKIEEKKHELVH